MYFSTKNILKNYHNNCILKQTLIVADQQGVEQSTHILISTKNLSPSPSKLTIYSVVSNSRVLDFVICLHTQKAGAA